ncbi:protein-L-isoaspartate(D-aspartate) O-methyltransferase [Parapedobacter sp. ISTM3]|uniref:Protein-L-isoaspartate O-methyltransferase n=1 Tax=Parapedobacter luteus TaxID=623280 RepID=A0A1T5F3N8_9SPHI|nr:MULTISPECIES: protein-L-isoaspartate(D-aspartate) O-methyltransferase [Parapedobacter]MBK1442188.1 protein-L-isoaspartate(D-aspartate) O-methyltransferase [Parapedobacter sp. ISTM3]SKB90749.1 protein-L-isoaspartate(D-aspartate) O-methyltransferase [Parapedobacter luteus]
MKVLTAILSIMQVACHGQLSSNYTDLRYHMVGNQLTTRGISHPATLKAMQTVERHLFVPMSLRKHAYDDTPLPIGYNQTISQPYIVAYMTQLLAPKASDRVLEIGTGSGYQAAVLAEIVREVYTIEIVPELGNRAKNLLQQQGYDNVTVIIGDGYKGLEPKAPFDAIVVTAAPEEIPPALIEQLKDGGKMIVPVGPPTAVQTLVLIEKKRGKVIRTELSAVRFVPFTREK